MLKAARPMLMYPSQIRTAGIGSEGSLPGLQPKATAIPRQRTPIKKLARGPTMAIQNSVFASCASDSIWETPPRANNVMARTRRPQDMATSECASSCRRRVAKKRTEVIRAAPHTQAMFQPGLTDRKMCCERKGNQQRDDEPAVMQADFNAANPS